MEKLVEKTDGMSLQGLLMSNNSIKSRTISGKDKWYELAEQI